MPALLFGSCIPGRAGGTHLDVPTLTGSTTRKEQNIVIVKSCIFAVSIINKRFVIPDKIKDKLHKCNGSPNSWHFGESYKGGAVVCDIICFFPFPPSSQCVRSSTERIKRMAPFVGNFISHSLRWGIHHRFLSRLRLSSCGYFWDKYVEGRVEFSIGFSLIIYAPGLMDCWANKANKASKYIAEPCLFALNPFSYVSLKLSPVRCHLPLHAN